MNMIKVLIPSSSGQGFKKNDRCGIRRYLSLNPFFIRARFQKNSAARNARVNAVS